MNNVSIIGAGLAGCEAALQLANNDFHVTLYDSKPQKLLDAYKLPTYAELICNNSIGNLDNRTPTGLLLQELETLGSKMISIAEKCRLDDPAFFAIDKKKFSQAVTDALYENHVTIVNRHVTQVPNDNYIIIATGPLTDEALIRDLSISYGIEDYHFSDASSPIVDIDTIDLSGKNVLKITEDLYAISIPISIFELFCNELVAQDKKSIHHDVDRSIDFEKCRSIEQLASVGIFELFTQRFCHQYFNTPCLLLRRENAIENGFILVGCMTTLSHSAQVSAFSLLPGFRKCKFIKYGRMHRNTFFNAPKVLNEFFQIVGTNTFIVGQLSGVDGYAPSIASGLVSSLRIIHGAAMLSLPQSTVVGGLSHYISNINVTDFQPMCASFSIMNCKNNFWEKSKQEMDLYVKSMQII